MQERIKKQVEKLLKLKQWLVKKSSLNANKLAKKEQLKHATVLFVIAIVSFGFYKSSSSPKKIAIKQEEAHFDGVFDAHFNQGSDEALIVEQQQQIDSLKELVTNKDKNHQEVAKAAPDEQTKALVEAMSQKLALLEEENKKTNEKLQVALVASQQASLGITVKPPTREEINARQKQRQHLEHDMLSKAGLETVQFRRGKKRDKTVRTNKNYVWAGTFAEGVLLTGILGDAGINGSKNMGTALIRLTSDGIMPNDQRSHLEGCSALVSTYGDLSGSSVVLQLQTLSCAGKEVNFEQRAYGAVFDLDAMQDLRGTSILKTKPLLGYSAAAGMLAGIGDGLKNYNTAQSVNPSVGTITTYGSATQLAQSAAGGALSNPANRISDYVMKIADIYHPLVVTRAGRKVSVLFTKGFWIDKEHQVYESGKAIEEAIHAQEARVKTTVSHPTGFNEGVNPDMSFNAPSQNINGQNQTMEPFLDNQGTPTQPLFSTLQTKESKHG